MIFFVANDGTVINSVPSPVYQGAANANNILLVAPFATNLQAAVAFKLPNGVYTERYPMALVNELTGIVNKQTGQVYAGWQFSMPNEITEYFGTVTAQFFFYSAQNKVVTATSGINFVVEKGVPEVLPDIPSTDVYSLILANISALQQQLNNGAFAARSIYAWNSAYSYGPNEITYVDSNGEYGALARSTVEDNKTPPFDSLGQLNAGWEIVSDFDEIYQLAHYGVAVKNATLIFSPSDPNVSVENGILIIKGGI